MTEADQLKPESVKIIRRETYSYPIAEDEAQRERHVRHIRKTGGHIISAEPSPSGLRYQIVAEFIVDGYRPYYSGKIK